MKWRALLAGALVAALALALSLTAGGATKRTSDDSLVGAGSSFAAPLLTAWYQYFNPKAGANVSYNSIGSGAGIAQITARTVDFGASDAPLTAEPGEGLQRLRPDPGHARHDRDPLQRPGRDQADQPDRARDRQHLPRQRHAVGRCGDQGDQPRREPAEPEDHPGVPLRRIGHELQHHRLPVEGEPCVRGQGRQVDAAAVPGRRRRPRQLRRRRRGHAAPRARSVTPTSRMRSRTSCALRG